MDDLKAATGGVPIGMKLVPSGMLEADLDIALEAGVDFITLDGAQAGTKGSAPILQDDFGLPTLFGLCRAVRHLERRGVSGTVSLLIAGGLKTPGECLKAIALGADAVYLGSTVLFAAAHNQIAKTLPWEPPTELVFAWGKLAHRFDPEQRAARGAVFARLRSGNRGRHPRPRQARHWGSRPRGPSGPRAVDGTGDGHSPCRWLPNGFALAARSRRKPQAAVTAEKPCP